MSFGKPLAVRALLTAMLLAACGLVPVPAVQAQAAGSTLSGRVRDQNGAPLPGATVTAAQSATGFSRTAVTGGDGTFRFPSIPVGLYTVTVELSGFATVTVGQVRLNVASERSIRVDTSRTDQEEEITAVDETPLVQTTPSIGTTVSEEQLENLPLSGRQLANLAILAPGTALAYNADSTRPGQLTVALNGGIGRNVNSLVDGGDNTDDTAGGALQSFNLESVAGLNIQTQQYKAELGRSTGGVLTAVTRSGTNDFAGSGWGFFRDDSLSSRTETEKRSRGDKPPCERQQYGVSFGGPIVRDRAHFFAAYERTDRDAAYTVHTGGVLPELDGESFPIPFEDDLATAKVTYDISARQYLQARYGYQKNADKYGAGPLAAPDSLGTANNEHHSILAGHTAQLGAGTLHELVFQYTRFENTITADSDNPSIYFPSGVRSGQNANTPQSTRQTQYQYKDDLGVSRRLGGRTHRLKTGINYIHEPVLGGSVPAGTNGQLTLLEDDPDSPVTDITFFGGSFGSETPVDQYSGYVQDDILVNDRLTVNVGLRYDYWDGFDLDQRSNPLWQALSTQTRYDESYLRDFQGGRGGVLSNDGDNWGPRLGFTYDLGGDGRKLLRGGWGIYYDFPYTNATIFFPSAAVQSNYGVVYNVHDDDGIRNPDGSFYRPGQPLPPNQLPGAGVATPNEVASPTLATPQARQASLGLSWQMTSWVGMSLEAVHVDYDDIPYRFRANPFVDADHSGEIDDGEVRRFPQFGSFRMWYGNGQAEYSGVHLSMHARFSDLFEVQAFYTWCEAEGNVLAGADEFRLTDGGHQADVGGERSDVPVNPLDPQCSFCFGPLNTDARHRITISALFRAPWELHVATLYRYRSALPYLEHANADLNADGFLLDLPPGRSANTGRGASFSQLDLRLSRELRFANGLSIEVIGEVFNLLNDDNPALFNRFGEANVYAGDPLQGEQRLGQVGVRLRL